MPRKKTQAEFIDDFIHRWGNDYDLSRVVYNNACSKIIIGCPEHGWVERRASHAIGKHSPSPCPKCGNLISGLTGKNRRKTTKEFIIEAIEIHNEFYDYSLVSYKGKDKKIKIICPIHGLFEQRPGSHLRGEGCRKCGFEKNASLHRMSKEEFISKSKIIHNEFYDYSLVEYMNTDSKVKIVCPIHDLFEQTPHKHLSGSGCFHCGNESKIGKCGGPGGYKSLLLTNNSNELMQIKPASFYIIHLFDNNEDFYKSGVTKNLSKRFASIRRESGYSLEEIDIIEYPSMYEAVIHELEFQEAQQRYYPVRKFPGYTECYKIS